MFDRNALSNELRAAARHLPEASRDSELRWRWVGGARRAQIALVATIVLGLFVFPTMRDALIDAVVPESSSRGFLGIRRRREASPVAEVGRGLLTGLYWLSGLGTSLGLLLLDLPVAVARRREAEGRSGAGELGTDATLLPTQLASPMASAAETRPGAPAPSIGASTGERPGGRYRIEKEIGRGGMGVVYRAQDQVLDRVVALKELPESLLRSPQLAERFRTEARVLARLAHPGIVQVFDLVEDPRGMWMALELVEGGSLDVALDERGALGERELVELGVAMAEALAFAHERGVVHRDFKPHNVLLTREGRPKITDFGLAKLVEGPQLTQAGALLGSPSYMSPEQASGREADARSDMYSFGVTLYQMATGGLPFEGETASVLIQHLTKPAPRAATRVESIAPELDALIARLLEKEPGARFECMEEVAAALRGIDAPPA